VNAGKAFIRMLTPRSEGMAEVLVRLVEGNSVTAASYTGMPGFARLVLPSQTNDGRVCDSRPTGPRSLRSSINNVTESSGSDQPTKPAASRNWLKSASVNSSPIKGQNLKQTISTAPPSTRIGRLVSGISTGLTSPSLKRHKPMSRSEYFTGRKAQSDSCNLDDHLFRHFRSGRQNVIDVDATTFEDEFEDIRSETSASASVKNETFGQAWQWFKQRRRITSAEVSVGVTYISLPWHSIIAEIIETKKTPVLTPMFMDNLT